MVAGTMRLAGRRHVARILDPVREAVSGVGVVAVDIARGLRTGDVAIGSSGSLRAVGCGVVARRRGGATVGEFFRDARSGGRQQHGNRKDGDTGETGRCSCHRNLLFRSSLRVRGKKPNKNGRARRVFCIFCGWTVVALFQIKALAVEIKFALSLKAPQPKASSDRSIYFNTWRAGRRRAPGSFHTVS